MSVRTKDEVAEWLAQRHYAVDSGVTQIFRIVTTEARESDPREPIRLLEVYEHTIPSGIVPVHFPPHPPSGLTFATEIVQIAPEELDQLKTNELQLPEGWALGQEYPRTNQPESQPHGSTR